MGGGLDGSQAPLEYARLTGSGGGCPLSDGHAFGAGSFPLRLRRSPRAKRLRLIVRADGVECVLPVICPERLAHDFIAQHRDWLLRKFREAVARTAPRRFWQEAAATGDLHFPLQGIPTRFSLRDSPSSRMRLSYDGEALLLQLPSPALDAAARIEQAVFAWARAWLGERAGAIVDRHAPHIAGQPRRIRIKRMRTRWGSCGAGNDINLNWLLIAVPPAVLEYVVVHELCHIRHRDHSARFWGLVAAHCPDFQQARGWLKAEGGSLLHRFGSDS
ncbi:MAG: M48 family metallopeptidase [Gammaproteobacteria bacterium]|nr:M48 family metallopeptidase [Gammaproteobacteria bacterium]